MNKTYTLEELKAAQAKGCRIDYKDNFGVWLILDNITIEELFNPEPNKLRIHPADEWKARLPRLREGAEWHRDDFTNEMLEGGYRPHLLGEAGEGEYLSDGKWKQDGPVTSTFPTGKNSLHTRTLRLVPPEFLHPDELAAQPEATPSTPAPDYGEPWQNNDD